MVYAGQLGIHLLICLSYQEHFDFFYDAANNHGLTNQHAAFAAAALLPPPLPIAAQMLASDRYMASLLAERMSLCEWRGRPLQEPVYLLPRLLVHRADAFPLNLEVGSFTWRVDNGEWGLGSNAAASARLFIGGEHTHAVDALVARTEGSPAARLQKLLGLAQTLACATTASGVQQALDVLLGKKATAEEKNSLAKEIQDSLALFLEEGEGKEGDAAAVGPAPDAAADAVVPWPMGIGVVATRADYNTHYTAMIGALCKVSMGKKVEAKDYAKVLKQFDDLVTMCATEVYKDHRNNHELVPDARSLGRHVAVGLGRLVGGAPIPVELDASSTDLAATAREAIRNWNKSGCFV